VTAQLRWPTWRTPAPHEARQLTDTTSRVQVHLLDATYELFRAHFAPRPQHVDAEGRPASATVGLMENVLYLLREDGVTHLGCAADHVIESWRNERYAGYKGSAGAPPELLAQFDQAEEALRALGVVVWPMVEWEADDALGTAAARWGTDPAVARLVIMTPDKDMAQCVREDGRVVQYDRRKRQFFTADDVRTKFGVSPASIPDFLALVGDASDGYPGIPGWGRVSAAAVLTRYEHIEDIPERAAHWDLAVRNAAMLAASLREHRDDAFLFRELATLVTDVPLTESLADLRWRGAHRAALTELAERLRAPQLISRIPHWLD
jgi:5'-3' exonuclease